MYALCTENAFSKQSKYTFVSVIHMAIYLDQRVDNGLNDSSLPPLRKHQLLRWHPKHELLMVASYADTHGGEINFFGDDVGVVIVWRRCACVG